jgi:SAM-dependent methyltransferase
MPPLLPSYLLPALLLFLAPPASHPLRDVGDGTPVAVRSQFEEFPYPPTKPPPARPGDRPVLQSPSHLVEVNHYLWGGRRDFCGAGKDRFRVLVAGGGTGGKTLQLAQQLVDMGARHSEIVHLDLSATSVGVAERELKKRGLDHKVSFVRASVLDAPGLGLGTFDYIDCLGVLNTLAEPWQGLDALRRLLKPHGGMGVSGARPIVYTGAHTGGTRMSGRGV